MFAWGMRRSLRPQESLGSDRGIGDSFARRRRSARWDFQKYLEERSEGCFDTEDFLTNGLYSATVHRFHEMLEGGILAVAPEDLVFQESEARLVGENGDPPEWF